MKRFTSQDPSFPAWVEVPDEWLDGHYRTYQSAYWGLAEQVDKVSKREAMVAGAVALLLKGDCHAEIPGIDLSGEVPDLSGVTAKAVGLLIKAIAFPLEATQDIPLALSEPSENGSMARQKREN